MNTHPAFVRAMMTDVTVNRMSKEGRSMEEIIAALVDDKTRLIGLVMQLESIAPRKIVLPDGKVMVWHCPDKLIPPAKS